jgi:hypothetical protein
LGVGVTGGVTGVLGAPPFCVFVDEPPELLDPLVLPDPPVPLEPEVGDVDVDPELEAAGVPDELASDPPQALNNNVKATAAAVARK